MRNLSCLDMMHCWVFGLMVWDNIGVLSSSKQTSKWRSVISQNGLLLLLLIQYSLLEECTNPMHHVTLAGQLNFVWWCQIFMGAHNGTCHMLHCWHLRILRWHPDFCKIYAHLVYNMKNLAAISVPLRNSLTIHVHLHRLLVGRLHFTAFLHLKWIHRVA